MLGMLVVWHILEDNKSIQILGPKISYWLSNVKPSRRLPVLLLCDLCEHLQALLHEILLDHSQDLVLLQGLTGDVQWQILGIHDALHKVQPLGHQFLAVVHDENSSHVEFDVVPLLLGFEEIERSPARNEQQSTELKLTLHAEVLHGKVILPVVGQGLVEACVLFICDVFRLPHPQRFVLVELFPLVGHFFNFFCLLFLLLLGAHANWTQQVTNQSVFFPKNQSATPQKKTKGA